MLTVAFLPASTAVGNCEAAIGVHREADYAAPGSLARFRDEPLRRVAGGMVAERTGELPDIGATGRIVDRLPHRFVATGPFSMIAAAESQGLDELQGTRSSPAWCVVTDTPALSGTLAGEIVLLIPVEVARALRPELAECDFEPEGVGVPARVRARSVDRRRKSGAAARVCEMADATFRSAPYPSRYLSRFPKFLAVVDEIRDRHQPRRLRHTANLVVVIVRDRERVGRFDSRRPCRRNDALRVPDPGRSREREKYRVLCALHVGCLRREILGGAAPAAECGQPLVPACARFINLRG